MGVMETSQRDPRWSLESSARAQGRAGGGWAGAARRRAARGARRSRRSRRACERVVDPAGPGREPAAGSGADPLRAHVGHAVHVPAWVGGRDGHRPGGGPADRPHRAIVRRCPPVELRDVLVARTPSRVRHQRLRRDASGSLRMGRQATRGQRRGRGQEQRVRQEDQPKDRESDNGCLSPGDRDRGGDEPPRSLLLPAGLRRSGQDARHGEERSAPRGEDTQEVRQEEQPRGARQAHRRGRRETRDRVEPTPDRGDER